MIKKEDFIYHFCPNLDYVERTYDNLVNIIRAAETEALPDDIYDLDDFLKKEIAKNISRFLLEYAIDYPNSDDGYETYCAVEKAWRRDEDDLAINFKDFVSFSDSNLFVLLENLMDHITEDFLIPNEFTQLTFIEKEDEFWAYTLSKYFNIVVIVK